MLEKLVHSTLCVFAGLVGAMGRNLALRAALATTLAWSGLFAGGNIVLTGHDDDYHLTEEQSTAAATQLKALIAFARNGSSLKILAFDHSSDLTAALSTLGIPYDRVDPDLGVPAASLFNHSVYSAVVIASDTSCGGCDNDSTSSANLASAASSFASFVNAGGGIVALAGASNTNYYKFLPASATNPGTVTCSTIAACFSQTAAGAKVGIPANNVDQPHNYFPFPGTSGMDPNWVVAETYTGLSDSGVSLNNQPFTVFIQNATVGSSGFGPTITNLSPSSATAQGPSFNLTITGTGFASGATVKWTNSSGQVTTLTPSGASSTQIVVSIPASLIASAGTAQVAVTVGTQTSANSPFTIGQTATISNLSPSSTTAGGSAFNLTINGTGFASGATVKWTNSSGQITTLTPSSISSTQIVVSIPASLIASAGTAQVAVTVGSVTSGNSAFTISQIAAPPLTLTLSSTPANVTVQPTLNLTVGSAPSTQLTGTLTLGFTPDANNLPAKYIDPAVQFAGPPSGTSLNFTIPAGSTTVSLPNNGQFSQGTVAGTLTITMTALNAGSASVLPSAKPSTTVSVARQAPAITSVSIINRTSSGFTVDVVAYSTTRDLSSATYTFTAASGSQLSGNTSFTVPSITSAANTWFAGSSGLSSGSRFDIQVPFTFTGSASAIGSVSVTLTNSVGTSTAVSGQ